MEASHAFEPGSSPGGRKSCSDIFARWLLFSFLWRESPPRNLPIQWDFRSLAYLWVYLFEPRCLLFPVPMAYYTYIPRCSIFVPLSWAIPE